ncbi:hypothetical protein AWC38_SpisGene19866 [Stylophora pistillata]|uniref:Uncharacterized protein n=1 Tax=Stylophora pistillata TaxID=50429 RepID=A0A2B4RHN4_STYPI|nr:hypothetical protein AWC38_SpisGene19866 [Stylophora pistillata]
MGKRVGVQCAKMTMSIFTTPRRFLTEIWPKVVSCKNGLADRILFLCQERVRREIKEIEVFSTQLVEERAVKSLGTVYEQIDVEHHQENAIEYTLSAGAREVKQGSTSVRMSVTDEDVKQRILTLLGPYCSSKRVYNSFSSSSRPTPKKTEECMRDLETASLGQVNKLGKSTVFYKTLPNILIHSQHRLGNLNMSLEQYKEKFLKYDDLLTSSQKEAMLDNHPKLQELRQYFISQNVEL